MPWRAPVEGSSGVPCSAFNGGTATSFPVKESTSQRMWSRSVFAASERQARCVRRMREHRDVICLEHGPCTAAARLCLPLSASTHFSFIRDIRARPQQGHFQENLGCYQSAGVRRLLLDGESRCTRRRKAASETMCIQHRSLRLKRSSVPGGRHAGIWVAVMRR